MNKEKFLLSNISTNNDCINDANEREWKCHGIVNSGRERERNEECLVSECELEMKVEEKHIIRYDYTRTNGRNEFH